IPMEGLGAVRPRIRARRDEQRDRYPGRGVGRRQRRRRRRWCRNELFVGDMTALAAYMAAQARPTTKIEVNNLHLLNPPLTATDISQINRGQTVFSAI